MIDNDDTTTGRAPPEPDPFAGIEAQAASLEAASIPPDPDAPPPVDHMAEAVELTEFALSVILPMLPERYADRYGPKQQQNIGRALGRWCEARDVSLGEMLGKWAPELALLAALVAPALPVILADVKARSEPQAKRPAAQPVQP